MMMVKSQEEVKKIEAWIGAFVVPGEGEVSILPYLDATL